jgi:hypothetical protein
VAAGSFFEPAAPARRGVYPRRFAKSTTFFQPFILFSGELFARAKNEPESQNETEGRAGEGPDRCPRSCPEGRQEISVKCDAIPIRKTCEAIG